MHYRHEVSAKIVLYSDDGMYALVMRYPRTKLVGLPGGHVERKEQPDHALRRELVEELGVAIGDIQRRDFFLREGDKGTVILAYTAVVSRTMQFAPPRPKVEFPEWVTREQLSEIANISDVYRHFILNNWPSQQP